MKYVAVVISKINLFAGYASINTLVESHCVAVSRVVRVTKNFCHSVQKELLNVMENKKNLQHQHVKIFTRHFNICLKYLIRSVCPMIDNN